MPDTLDLRDIINPEDLADAIAIKYTTWRFANDRAMSRAREVLDYVFAESTTDIQNASREWENTTHIPIIASIRNTLISNYKNSIFSTKNYIDWETPEGLTVDSQKRDSLRDFTNIKLRAGGFKNEIEKCLKDYVDYGAAFGMVYFESETIPMPGGLSRVGYEGGKFKRIAPEDIVFDPTAEDFQKTPKILKSLYSIGELKRLITDSEHYGEMANTAFKKAVVARQGVRDMTNKDVGAYDKAVSDESAHLQIAGFSSYQEYMASDMVEVLTFYGDYYDVEADKFYRNSVITVIDRAYVMDIQELPDLGWRTQFFSSLWTDYKGTLWGMSPLTNLVGMNYRINYLENKKADVYNLATNPMWDIVGDVDMPDTLGPGAKFYRDSDAAINPIRMDTSILQSSGEMANYKQLMEYAAGTPESLRGVRTPGEKTALEVDTLDSRAEILFYDKITNFEESLMAPAVNCIVATSMYYQDGQEVETLIRDQVSGDKKMGKVSIADLLSIQGSFVTVGSRRAQTKERLARTLVQLGNSAIYSDPLVRNNFDPDVEGKIIAYATGLDEFDIYKKGIRAIKQGAANMANENANQVVDETVAEGVVVPNENVQ